MQWGICPPALPIRQVHVSLLCPLSFCSCIFISFHVFYLLSCAPPLVHKIHSLTPHVQSSDHTILLFSRSFTRCINCNCYLLIIISIIYLSLTCTCSSTDCIWAPIREPKSSKHSERPWWPIIPSPTWTCHHSQIHNSGIWIPNTIYWSTLYYHTSSTSTSIVNRLVLEALYTGGSTCYQGLTLNGLVPPVEIQTAAKKLVLNPHGSNSATTSTGTSLVHSAYVFLTAPLILLRCWLFL